MVQEAYCSFETAKLLKEKGFNERSAANYDSKGQLQEGYGYWNKTSIWYAAPTHQMAMKWLREVHNICITIYPDKVKGYEAVLYNIKDDVEIILQSFGIYGYHIFEDSYEQACEVALKYTLENLI